MAINFTNLNNATVAYYKLDENTGTTAFDSVGTKDIIFTGSPSWSSGIINSNINLGTTSETKYGKISGETFDFVRTTGEFTVSFWWKPDNYLESALSTLISSGSASSGDDIGWELTYEQRSSQGSPQRLQFRAWDGTGGGASAATIYLFSPNNAITSNDRVHILIKGDGTTAKMYINNVEVSSASITLATGTSTDPDFTLGNSFRSFTGQGEFDELLIADKALTQDEISYLYNNDAPTVNQQYPFSPNVETLELDTLNFTSSLQDVNIKNIINEQLDVLQINSNLQDITFKNTIKEELQPITFSLALQDIQFTTADILNLTPLQFNSSLQDITFKNTIKEDLDTLTFNTNLQDVEIKNTIQFTLDPLQFNLNLLNVSLPEPQIETLELEPLVFNLGLNDIKFKLVGNPLLDSARNDIQQVLEEIGELITYRRLSKELDDVGQLKEVTTTHYQTLALFEDGDDKNKETNQYGEFIAGTQNVNIAYQVSDGVYPKVRDIIIDINGVEWEIIQVKPSRLYGGVWDNNIVVERKTNY